MGTLGVASASGLLLNIEDAMTDKLVLTVTFDLPADLFERAELITRIGAPAAEAREVWGTIVGAPIGIKHEIVTDAPAPPTKRTRGPNKPKLTEQQLRDTLVAGATRHTT